MYVQIYVHIWMMMPVDSPRWCFPTCSNQVLLYTMRLPLADPRLEVGICPSLNYDLNIIGRFQNENCPSQWDFSRILSHGGTKYHRRPYVWVYIPRNLARKHGPFLVGTSILEDPGIPIYHQTHESSGLLSIEDSQLKTL